MVAHEPRRHAGGAGDPPDRRPVEPVLGEVVQRGVPDPGAGGQVLEGGTATAGRPATTARKPIPREEELAFYAAITARQIRITRATRTALRVLLAAGEEELHGLEISNRTGLNDGTIYPLLARLREAGWITSRREDHACWLARNPPGQRQHPRRRNHQLTSHGRQAARRELARPGRQRP